MSDQNTPLIHVTFTSHLNEQPFEAEVSGETTGQQCIDELIAASFITPSREDRNNITLVLKRTGATIPKSSTMAQQNVKSGDIILVDVAVTAAAGRV